METVRSDFDCARQHLENTPGLVDKASPEAKLRLYGLYKQATCGDCNEDAPSMFNVKAKLKHDAWVQQKGLSSEEAYRTYTKVVAELDPSLRLPSQSNSAKRSIKISPGSAHGSSNSLSNIVRSESRDFLDRLLGAPPRLTSPLPSGNQSEQSSPRRDDDTEEKSSIGSNGGVLMANGKRKLSLLIGRNGSLEELKKMSSYGEDPSSSSSSVVSQSAPTTPQNGPLQSVLRMPKSSSLTWGKAEDYTPLIDQEGRRNRRRKSEGDDMDLDDEEEDDDSSNMEWDTDNDEVADRRMRRNHLYFDDEDNSDRRRGSSVWDDDEDDEDEEDEYGEAKMKRKRDDNGSEDETIIGTLLFTMPFVFFLKVYQLFSSIFFMPLTAFLQVFGFRVQKAPDTVSVREKKQAASLLMFASILPMTPIVYMWMFFFLIFPFTTLPTAAYVAWMLYWDESPRDGSRKPILKDVPFTKYFVEYFPITLSRKSAPLDPQKKYVFAYHPHGIIGLGAFGAFATHAAGFKEKFPGLDMRLLTLDNNFKVPIIREILLGFGVCSCSRKACDGILQRGPGSAITLVVGGAAESLETERGTYRLVLGRRGFVQVAIDNDADLVPVIAFGETDAFETFSAKPGTILREIQVYIQRKIKFTVPIFWGRGMFNTNFGLMPKRRPIHVVTGEPLSIKPFRDRGLQGEELLDAVHKAYIAALRRLFDENKDENEAGIKRKESLTIIK